MNPDDVFGPCLPPRKGDVKPHEWEGKPTTLRQLDPNSGKWLTDYMLSVPSHDLHELFAYTSAILWIMDDAQAIFVAIEEVRYEVDDTIRLIYPRNGFAEMPEKLLKYGHPSLLPPVRPNIPGDRTKWARCGGDIIYDPGPHPTNPWRIRFNSGRYGYRDHLGQAQLSAVAQEFANNGVSLDSWT